MYPLQCQKAYNTATLKGVDVMTLQERLERLAELCDVVMWNKSRTGFIGKTYIGNGDYIREYTYICGAIVKTIAGIPY